MLWQPCYSYNINKLLKKIKEHYKLPEISQMSRRMQELSMVTMAEMIEVASYETTWKYLEIYLFPEIHSQALPVILLEIYYLFGEKEKCTIFYNTMR